MITEADFPFLAEKGHVVSLVGGGGKTTLLYAMAECCARRGWHVLVATTTHILRPQNSSWVQTDTEISARWASGGYAVVGTPAAENKLMSPPAVQLEHWMAQADTVFLEADGAKHCPCKVPAAHEPVLLPQSDIVLAVAGLSALGKPLRQVCFRYEEACSWLGTVPESVLSPQLLARLLADAQGGRKAVEERQFYAVLNQADDPYRRQLGRQIQAELAKAGIKSVLTCFTEGERA